MTRTVFLLFCLLHFYSCSGVNPEPPAANMPKPSMSGQVVGQKKEAERAVIGDTLGVVVLSKNYGKKDFVNIYNSDGSTWYRFTFYYDDKDGVFEYANDDFRPLAFHPDYFLLVLKCVGKVEGRYEVVVNEETSLKKYVRTDDRSLRLEPWEEHILKVFAIKFDKVENPLLEQPEGEAKVLSLPENPVFQPKEIKGAWLRVQWASTNQTDTRKPLYNSGWIQWKRDGKLLVDLSYIS